MVQNTRRNLLKAGTALGATGLIGVPAAHAQTWNNEPEKGARLRVLRWSRFVQGDIDTYMANVKKFTEKYRHRGPGRQRGLGGRAAQGGGGCERRQRSRTSCCRPTTTPTCIRTSCWTSPTSANTSASKYGGWYPSVEAYLRPDGKRWIGVGLGSAGAMMVYRQSHVKAAGFDSFPKDTDGFLKMMKALKEKGTPGGFALGNATGDSGWTHWLMWAFGGKLVDKDNKVVINSPETIKALEYGRELYATFVPGTLSWLDPNNNKAFLDEQISVTNNGISVYYAAKNSKDPKVKAMAEDIQHAAFPVGPVGEPTEYHLFFNQMIFKYTKYPEGRQGVPALHDGGGAVQRVAGRRRRVRLAAAACL